MYVGKEERSGGAPDLSKTRWEARMGMEAGSTMGGRSEGSFALRSPYATGPENVPVCTKSRLTVYKEL